MLESTGIGLAKGGIKSRQEGRLRVGKNREKWKYKKRRKKAIIREI